MICCTLTCGHRVLITGRAGNDDDGDRECVLGVELTVPEPKTGTMCLQVKGGRKVSFAIKAAGQVTDKRLSLCGWAGLSTQTNNSSSR